MKTVYVVKEDNNDEEFTYTYVNSVFEDESDARAYCARKNAKAKAEAAKYGEDAPFNYYYVTPCEFVEKSNSPKSWAANWPFEN